MTTGLPEMLVKLRTARGLSQREAAADLGISQALLSHYENGNREPGLSFVVRACDYYDVTADYILGRSGENGNEALRELGMRIHELATLVDELSAASRRTQR